MAQTMVCDGCAQLPAIVMVTQIGTGNVLAFCGGCSGLWAEGHAAVIAEALGADYTGNMPLWLRLALEAEKMPSEPVPEPVAAKPARKRASKVKTPADPEYPVDRTIGEIIETSPRSEGDQPQEGDSDGALQQRDSGLRTAGEGDSGGGRVDSFGPVPDRPPY